MHEYITILYTLRIKMLKWYSAWPAVCKLVYRAYRVHGLMFSVCISTKYKDQSRFLAKPYHTIISHSLLVYTILSPFPLCLRGVMLNALPAEPWGALYWAGPGPGFLTTPFTRGRIVYEGGVGRVERWVWSTTYLLGPGLLSVEK